jgi:hypothetical protein
MPSEPQRSALRSTIHRLAARLDAIKFEPHMTVFCGPSISFRHDQIVNVFTFHLNQDTAAKFHSARSQAFSAWAEITGVAMAA